MSCTKKSQSKTTTHKILDSAIKADIMENPVRLAKSEIRNWLEIRGYHCKDIYVIDNVIVEC